MSARNRPVYCRALFNTFYTQPSIAFPTSLGHEFRVLLRGLGSDAVGGRFDVNMATGKHKAATSVVLAPLAEKSAFEQFVGAYWKYGVALAAVIVGVVAYTHHRDQERLETRREAWDRLIEAAGMEGFSPSPTGSPEALASLASQTGDAGAASWARIVEAQVSLDKRSYAGARAAVEGLRSGDPAHLTGKAIWRGSAGAARVSATELLVAAIEERERWDSSHANLFANPNPPSDAPRLILKTSAGDVSVTLYSDKAPQHVANFIALASEGYFNGTKFHRIVAGRSIEGGDPNTRGDDQSTWGKGGNDKSLPVELTGLFHFAGVLTALEGAETGKSSGGRFALTCEPEHASDGQRVVFGVVTAGLEVVRSISNAPLAANSTDLPAEPVVLNSVERL